MMRAVPLVEQKGEQDQLWNRDCRLLAVNKNPAHFQALSRQPFFGAPIPSMAVRLGWTFYTKSVLFLIRDCVKVSLQKVLILSG